MLSDALKEMEPPVLARRIKWQCGFFVSSCPLSSEPLAVAVDCAGSCCPWKTLLVVSVATGPASVERCPVRNAFVVPDVNEPNLACDTDQASLLPSSWLVLVAAEILAYRDILYQRCLYSMYSDRKLALSHELEV